MESKIIKMLSKEIVEKLREKVYNIEIDMEKFLKTQINEENKEKALEQLYLFQLYSNAYVGPDPKGKRAIFGRVNSLLASKDDEELLSKIEILKQDIELMKAIEINPISTIKRKLEDKEKNMRF